MSNVLFWTVWFIINTVQFWLQFWKRLKRNNIYVCWCVDVWAHPTLTPRHHLGLALSSAIHYAMKNTRLFLWHFIKCNSQPPPICAFSPPALQGPVCHSVCPVTVPLVPSSMLSVRAVVGAVGAWPSLDCWVGGREGLINMALWQYFHHMPQDLWLPCS